MEAAEMWYYRRMLRIFYTDHVSNEEVLQRISIKRELRHTVKIRQTKFLEHAFRMEVMADLRLGARIPGKRARGGQRRTFLGNFNMDIRRLGTWQETGMTG